MALENTEVIDNLTKQKEDIETKFEQFARQKQMLEQECERLRIMHGKISGALEVLTQIEESKNPAASEAATEEAVAEEALAEDSAEEAPLSELESPDEPSNDPGEGVSSRFAEVAS